MKYGYLADIESIQDRDDLPELAEEKGLVAKQINGPLWGIEGEIDKLASFLSEFVVEVTPEELEQEVGKRMSRIYVVDEEEEINDVEEDNGELHFVDKQKDSYINGGDDYGYDEYDLVEEDVNPRRATDDLISAIEDKFVTWEKVARACLKYMSEDDVKDMCRLNDFNIAEDEQLDEMLKNKQVKINENMSSDEEAIMHYEADLPELLHTVADMYMRGKISAKSYAKALKIAYSAFESIPTIKAESLSESVVDSECRDDSYVVIEAGRDGYGIDQVEDDTMTIGDLIDELEDYGRDTKVVLGNDRQSYGYYTYGYIDSYRIKKFDKDSNEDDDY